MECSLPGSFVHGIFQARIPKWVAISFSNALKRKVKVKLLSHVPLCDPMDCSLPGSFVHGIFQASVLEWVAISFSTSTYWGVWFQCYEENSPPGGASPLSSRYLLTVHLLQQTGSVMKWGLKKKLSLDLTKTNMNFLIIESQSTSLTS